jgi:GT2 family glycosyltransferase
MTEKSSFAIDITLLVCTYNRSEDLREMLETALKQETGGEFAYEVLVVDNNSTDDTPSIVEEFIARGHENLRYLFESRQGKSYALNTGLDAARGSIFTICDDDFILPENWLKNIFAAFGAHPEASFVSGKVLPAWQGEPPSWLTPEHWSAIALTDYGEKEFYADENNQICLLACSFRMADVKAVGGYNPKLGVTKNQIGGTEDFDILKRLWKSGRKGIYIPHIWFIIKSHRTATQKNTIAGGTPVTEFSTLRCEKKNLKKPPSVCLTCRRICTARRRKMSLIISSIYCKDANRILSDTKLNFAFSWDFFAFDEASF